MNLGKEVSAKWDEINEKYPNSDRYLIPTELIKLRLNDLPERIKGLTRLKIDTEELDSNFDQSRLLSRIQDLLYEIDFLGKCIKERE